MKENKAHLPVMLGALALINRTIPELRALVVLPNQKLVDHARSFELPRNVRVQSAISPGP